MDGDAVNKVVVATDLDAELTSILEETNAPTRPWRGNGKRLRNFAKIDSERRQNWATAAPLFREIERRFSGGGFTLDPCAESWSAKCARFYTERDNGLVRAWCGENGEPARVFCNPPYDNIAAWVERSLGQVRCGNSERVVLRSANRSDQRWFHDFVKPRGRVHHIVGRVNFCPPPGLSIKGDGAFEASIVVVFERPIVASDFRGGAQ